MKFCDHCHRRPGTIPFYGERVCFDCAEHNRPAVSDAVRSVSEQSRGMWTMGDRLNGVPWGEGS